jgi:hypothetical protein
MPEEELKRHGLEDEDWKILIGRIKSQKCIPFIGPGFCKDYYPTKSKIAEKWAESEGYPFEDKKDLARVSLFLEVKGDEWRTKERLVDEFKANCKLPDFEDESEPHRILADLTFPLYITTNYDNFLIEALKKHHKDPYREHCKWRVQPKRGHSTRSLSVANPMVFHLYGHTDEPASLILTEKDYMGFLLNVTRFEGLIPREVQGAIMGTLLFLGYHLDDWDFRILLAVLRRFFDSGLSEWKHVAVQLVPINERATPLQREQAQEHFGRYLQKNFSNVSVYWGTCQEFVKELRDRWNKKGD